MDASLVSVICAGDYLEVFLDKEVAQVYSGDVNNYVLGSECILTEFNETHFSQSKSTSFHCER